MCSVPLHGGISLSGPLAIRLCLLNSSGSLCFWMTSSLEHRDESVSLRVTTPRPPLDTKGFSLFKNLTAPLKEICQNPVPAFQVGNLPALLCHCPLLIMSPEVGETHPRSAVAGCAQEEERKTFLPSCPETLSHKEQSERVSTSIKTHVEGFSVPL